MDATAPKPCAVSIARGLDRHPLVGALAGTLPLVQHAVSGDAIDIHDGSVDRSIRLSGARRQLAAIRALCHS